jgi:CheY-like chemotaxis protein
MARILVTDDEEPIRGLLRRALELDGHEVECAADGAAALAELASRPYDLLLSDIRMPVMDGIALALASAREWPRLTILLMTGYAEQRERAVNLQALIHDVVLKPFTIADIRTAVAEALAANSAAA